MNCFKLKNVEIDFSDLIIDIKSSSKKLLKMYNDYDSMSKTDKRMFDKICLVILKSVSEAESQHDRNSIVANSPRKVSEADNIEKK